MSEISQQTDNKNKKIRSKKTSTRIDMTPMVDLAFLLLTFFVMTTSLIKSHILKIETPERETEIEAPLDQKNLLTLILEKDNSVYWYMGIHDPILTKTDFSKDGIRKVLFQKKNELPKLFVFIKASDHSKYQNMIDLMDEITITGISRYSLEENTPKDSELIRKVIK